MSAQNDIILSVVIVNYNVCHFLEQALVSVEKASAGLAMEVFVVDNNSVDKSVAMVEEKFPWVHLIANKDNPGFSKANNQAIRIANGKYILLLNPDTVVEEDTFSKVVNFMDLHPKAGGLGIRMIDGSGNFLPESKRGFPSPFVAFCKTFGLASLFPKSPTFNRYHLGYLDEFENHEIDVLSGAFMLMPKAVLDEIGLLDEDFFMYGEDIDLSYRIKLAGYENHYFSESTIIHYKGESTKKGSLNYVRTFYNAMIIFARKHFSGEKAWLFILMLQAAIYFRAAITLVTNFLAKALLPMMDAAIIYLGLYVSKNFWAISYYKDPDYYTPEYLWINAPLYISIWLLSAYLSGAYDRREDIWRLVRGLAIGTVLLAAVYGFLPEAYRPSRALVLLGAMWSLFTLPFFRLCINFFKTGKLSFLQEKTHKVAIVGSEDEANRVLGLLSSIQVNKNIIGRVSPTEAPEKGNVLGQIYQLAEMAQIYEFDELIFCSKDVSAHEIMRWMSQLGPSLDYKILPEKSLTIIGSSSKNSSGELYTIDIQYHIDTPMNRRNKRLMDILISSALIISLPISFWGVKKKTGFIGNIFRVLIGKKTWVGYESNTSQHTLPKIRPSVLVPKDALKLADLSPQTIQRLNYLYAKDYSIGKDLEIIWRGLFGR